MKMIQGSFTKRALMVALIAGSGILAASSFAMNGSGPGKQGCEFNQSNVGQTQSLQAKRGEHRARHLAALKESLKLTPAQESAWNAFTQTRQPVMQQNGFDRQARQAKHDEFAKLTTPQRLDKMLAMSEQRRARMVERAEAVKSFYVQLTPEQQSVFDAKAKPARQHGRNGNHGNHGQHRQS